MRLVRILDRSQDKKQNMNPVRKIDRSQEINKTGGQETGDRTRTGQERREETEQETRSEACQKKRKEQETRQETGTERNRTGEMSEIIPTLADQDTCLQKRKSDTY